MKGSGKKQRRRAKKAGLPKQARRAKRSRRSEVDLHRELQDTRIASRADLVIRKARQLCGTHNRVRVVEGVEALEAELTLVLFCVFVVFVLGLFGVFVFWLAFC